MGQVAQVRNQFKSINTFEKSFDCIISLLRKVSLGTRNSNVCLDKGIFHSQQGDCSMFL